ncbi:hypothetical protein E8E11_004711 [Didymella keratinophila]|nr:hypothetical protein E8E11_004711 [Didymella keratinophila]
MAGVARLNTLLASKTSKDNDVDMRMPLKILLFLKNGSVVSKKSAKTASTTITLVYVESWSRNNARRPSTRRLAPASPAIRSTSVRFSSYGGGYNDGYRRGSGDDRRSSGGGDCSNNTPVNPRRGHR